jgi:glycosyltransferase involved in cell wall biosynthesis
VVDQLSLPPSTCVIIPAFNEGTVFEKVLTELLRLYPFLDIIVVDDGSTDDTFAIASRFPVHRLRHFVNLGQGAALQTGIAYALQKGMRYFVTFDADDQMSPDDIPRMGMPLFQGEADVCVGNRFFASAPPIPFWRGLLIRLGAWWLTAAIGLPLEDSQNGFRAFTSSVASKIHLRNNRMAHSTEMLRQMASFQVRLKQVPVTIRYSSYSLKKGQKNWNILDIIWELVLG